MTEIKIIFRIYLYFFFFFLIADSLEFRRVKNQTGILFIAISIISKHRTCAGRVIRSREPLRLSNYTRRGAHTHTATALKKKKNKRYGARRRWSRWRKRYACFRVRFSVLRPLFNQVIKKQYRKGTKNGFRKTDGRGSCFSVPGKLF